MQGHDVWSEGRRLGVIISNAGNSDTGVNRRKRLNPHQNCPVAAGRSQTELLARPTSFDSSRRQAELEPTPGNERIAKSSVPDVDDAVGADRQAARRVVGA